MSDRSKPHSKRSATIRIKGKADSRKASCDSCDKDKKRIKRDGHWDGEPDWSVDDKRDKRGDDECSYDDCCGNAISVIERQYNLTGGIVEGEPEYEVVLRDGCNVVSVVTLPDLSSLTLIGTELRYTSPTGELYTVDLSPLDVNIYTTDGFITSAVRTVNIDDNVLLFDNGTFRLGGDEEGAQLTVNVDDDTLWIVEETTGGGDIEGQYELRLFDDGSGDKVLRQIWREDIYDFEAALFPVDLSTYPATFRFDDTTPLPGTTFTLTGDDNTDIVYNGPTRRFMASYNFIINTEGAIAANFTVYASLTRDATTDIIPRSSTVEPRATNSPEPASSTFPVELQDGDIITFHAFANNDPAPILQIVNSALYDVESSVNPSHVWFVPV